MLQTIILLAILFHLNQESSCFDIPVELSFQDGEFIFHKLSSRINTVIELTSHFLTVIVPPITSFFQERMGITELA